LSYKYFREKYAGWMRHNGKTGLLKPWGCTILFIRRWNRCKGGAVMKLNQRDRDVLRILHSSDQALTVTQIVKSGYGLTQSTVQAVIRKLLSAGLIEVQEIKYSGNVLCRAFCTTEKSKEILNQWLLDIIKEYKRIIGIRAVVQGMIELEEDAGKRTEDILELEKLLGELEGR